MRLEEYSKIDEEFNRSKFIGDVNRMILNIFGAISDNQIDSLRLNMSDEVFNKLRDRVNNLEKDGSKLKYNNVSVDSEIVDITDSEKPIIKVNAVCKYSKYFVFDNEIVRGSNTDTISVVKHFGFSRDDRAVTYYKCDGCGTSYDVRDGKICPNCGKSFSQELYSYDIVEME